MGMKPIFSRAMGREPSMGSGAESLGILVGDKEMIVWWSMKAGAHATAHQHPHEQIFWVLKGKMEFRLGSDKRICGPGDLGLIPGGIEHEAWFPEDTDVIDVFAPPRQDFLTSEVPAYMRKG